ncbi:MAG: hypothetical protein KF905_07095 [Flavobacteriales bacterium]|nr:hypothetical protein [Flavobacteriales bacterium]
MKKSLLVLSFALTAAFANAQSSGFGLGIVLGEPTGLSAKAWSGGNTAFAFGLAWGGWGRGGYFHAHADYLFHNMNLINVSSGRMALHYGPGFRMRSWSGDRYWNNGRYYDSRGGHTRLGVRFPVGLTYMFDGAPVDIFLEAAPTLDLIPGTSFDIGGGLGFRYYFGG